MARDSTVAPADSTVAPALRLQIRDVEAGYGAVRALHGVSVDVSEMRAARAAIKKNGAAAAMDLSKREREVTGLLAAGKTNNQVATQLGISVRTAEAHRARIMRKLRLGSVAALVRYALQSGLINE